MTHGNSVIFDTVPCLLAYTVLYQVTGGDLKRTVLWDITGKKEIVARIGIIDYSKATYEPQIGDVWYARILPPMSNDDDPWTVFTTPYIFRQTGRKEWEEFFARRGARKAESRESLAKYLKQGNSIGYWLEFVFQTYVGHTREVIFAEGLPDIKESRPHGNQDGGRLS